jgi:hypothetical protein
MMIDHTRPAGETQHWNPDNRNTKEAIPNIRFWSPLTILLAPMPENKMHIDKNANENQTNLST